MDAGTAYTAAAYMRIASLAIAGYDYLETQPTAARFYKEHWRNRTFSITVVLFVAIRFISILTLVVSNVGFFHSGFTINSCARFYLFPPIFKVLQAMVSQAILGVRAFNLSRRSKRVGYLLLTTYFSAAILQWVTTLYQRHPRIAKEPLGNCRAFNEAKVLGAWVFYVVAMIYDTGITAMSVYFLLKYRLSTKSTLISRVTKMMMYDGLGYLLVLTGINVLNLLLYKTPSEIQTAGSSLGYCVTWIMSQRLLVHLYDASREREEDVSSGNVTITRHITTSRDISRVVRSHLDSKSMDLSRISSSESEPEHEARGRQGPPHPTTFPEEMGVHVRVERTVTARRDPHARVGLARNGGYEMERYSNRHTTRNTESSRISSGV